MSLSNVSDIQTEVLVRTNNTTTAGFITDAFLNDWIRMAHVWACSYRKWPFSEIRDRTLSFSGTEETPYTSFTVPFKADSIRMLQIGGKLLTKLNMEDYLIFREQSPAGTDRVFSDYDRIVYINPSIDASGTITAYGQYQPTLDPTDKTATTLFSTRDEEGNEALVEKMTSYLKRREHLPDEAEVHDQRASLKLDEVWTRVQDEQFNYKTHRDRGGMFTRIDVVDGLNQGDFKRDQFSHL